MSTTKTNETSNLESKQSESTPVSSKKKTVKKVEVDPIAEEVKKRYSTGLYNVNQLAAQFMVHYSRINKILGK